MVIKGLSLREGDPKDAIHEINLATSTQDGPRSSPDAGHILDS